MDWMPVWKRAADFLSILKSDKPLYLSLLHPRDFQRFSRPVLWSANSFPLGPRALARQEDLAGSDMPSGTPQSRLTLSIGCSVLLGF